MYRKNPISKIVGNTAWTENDTLLFSDLTHDEQVAVRDWILHNLYKTSRPLYSSSSYGLKHLLEADTGIYLTNNQFKDSMLEFCFEPVDPSQLNWNYCISKTSPCFTHKGGTYERGEHSVPMYHGY